MWLTEKDTANRKAAAWLKQYKQFEVNAAESRAGDAEAAETRDESEAVSTRWLSSCFPLYDSPDNGNESGPQCANSSAYIKDPFIYYRHKKSLSSVEIDSRRGQDEETPVWFSGSAYEGTLQQMISFFYH